MKNFVDESKLTRAMKNYIDENKLKRVPTGTIFGYRDVVSDVLDTARHSKYGEIFKNQVEEGLIKDVAIEKETDARMLYRKL
ncbi:MAG: hypothetical protein CVU84_00820 [Firmicutes bacterium HGW-Firmicutes-1]|jgi:hypothetical protein|nr:MAG: hypothetical protein CVU84_00820 [Firmicutes bacterium HGW-Firmicutes-1]